MGYHFLSGNNIWSPNFISIVKMSLVFSPVQGKSNAAKIYNSRNFHALNCRTLRHILTICSIVFFCLCSVGGGGEGMLIEENSSILLQKLNTAKEIETAKLQSWKSRYLTFENFTGIIIGRTDLKILHRWFFFFWRKARGWEEFWCSIVVLHIKKSMYFFFFVIRVLFFL